MNSPNGNMNRRRKPLPRAAVGLRECWSARVCWIPRSDHDPAHREFHSALEAQLPGDDTISLPGSHSDVPVLPQEACALGGRGMRVDRGQWWLDCALPSECSGNIGYTGVGCRFDFLLLPRRETIPGPSARRLAKGIWQ